jgi:hypothetical protein
MIVSAILRFTDQVSPTDRYRFHLHDILIELQAHTYAWSRAFGRLIVLAVFSAN